MPSSFKRFCDSASECLQWNSLQPVPNSVRSNPNDRASLVTSSFAVCVILSSLLVSCAGSSGLTARSEELMFDQTTACRISPVDKLFKPGAEFLWVTPRPSPLSFGKRCSSLRCVNNRTSPPVSLISFLDSSFQVNHLCCQSYVCCPNSMVSSFN